jgi:tRNA pseudouridine55 synthase
VIHGFFVIDKPAGITSHDVVSRVRRILGTRKVGHTGTLDPFATGVLPVAVNDGTKVIPFLDEGVKCYQALMRLGVVTDTLDMTGRVMAEGEWSSVDLERFLGLLPRFTGVISQVPPMFSAIKRDGQPLYRLARQGVEVAREARQVEIHSLELLSFQPPLVGLQVTCSRGTYVRTLADDLGAELGCGASLQELRRIASGPFHLSSAMSLEGLEQAVREGAVERFCLTPYAALGHLPDIPLTDAGLAKVRHGRAPEWGETTMLQPHCVAAPGLARLSHGGGLAAVARLEPASDGPSRLVLQRVFGFS